MSATISDSMFGATQPSDSGVPPGMDPLRAPARLTARPPERVLRALAELGIDSENLLLSTITDIDLLGNYDPVWFVVTRERLAVIGEKQADVRIDLALSSIREFRAQAGVGSGLLQAKV